MPRVNSRAITEEGRALCIPIDNAASPCGFCEVGHAGLFSHRDDDDPFYGTALESKACETQCGEFIHCTDREKVSAFLRGQRLLAFIAGVMRGMRVSSLDLFKGRLGREHLPNRGETIPCRTMRAP